MHVSYWFAIIIPYRLRASRCAIVDFRAINSNIVISNYCLLYTSPSPMAFLSDILNRPPSDKPYLIIPVGFPSENAEVPNIKKKTFKEICTIL